MPFLLGRLITGFIAANSVEALVANNDKEIDDGVCRQDPDL